MFVNNFFHVFFEAAMIANQIKELREHLGLKPAQFAAKLEEKLQRIQDIERGKQRAPEDILCRIVEIFHVSGDWLLTGRGNMFSGVEPSNVEAIRLSIQEVQAWQVREQKFIDVAKIADVVFTITELAEGNTAGVGQASERVLRLVA